MQHSLEVAPCLNPEIAVLVTGPITYRKGAIIAIQLVIIASANILIHGGCFQWLLTYVR